MGRRTRGGRKRDRRRTRGGGKFNVKAEKRQGREKQELGGKPFK